MDSASNSRLSFSMDGSQLLDMTAGLPPDSNDVDLSLADLSMDQTVRINAPFSLLSRHKVPETPSGGEEDEEYNGEGDRTQRQEIESSDDEDTRRRKAGKMREEKLQSDIFVLKKLNAAFASFNEALDETGSANQRVAAQLAETDALLNKYVNILSKTEEFAKLVFDEEWYGQDADEAQIEREIKEEQQRRAEEARERELAARREAERREREEQERIEMEERERLEAKKRERSSTRGVVRGVRGTRASMRGTRGVSVPPRPVPASTASMSARTRTPAASSASSGIPVKRGTPTGTSSSTRGSTATRGSTLSRRT